MIELSDGLKALEAALEKDVRLSATRDQHMRASARLLEVQHLRARLESLGEPALPLGS